MATRPGYIYSGSEWVSIGQDAAVSPFKYQATAPTSPATGDIWIDSSSTVNSIDSTQMLRWRKTMAGGETSLSGNDDASLPLTYTPGYEQLYINGVLQVRSVDYTATTGSTITALTALVANDVVEIFSAVARAVSDVYTQSQSDARFVNKNVGGMNIIIPTSVTVSSGSASVATNGAVTFTSAVNLALDGIFTSAYKNYRIVFQGYSASNVSCAFVYRYGSGTDYTSADYSSQRLYSYSTTVQSARTSAGTSGTFPDIGTTWSMSINEIFDPYTSGIYTRSISTGMYNRSEAATSPESDFHTNTTNSSTQMTGIKFTAGGAALTGNIYIYGYNNGA